MTVQSTTFATPTCATCPAHNAANLVKLGVDMDNWDYVVALAGNPNVGKSTVFNALTGLKQHTGNWPGKTVTRAEGGFVLQGVRFKLVDLPGTYSLLSSSTDEDVARDFILFGEPDVTLIVVDANRLERNLNLVLQVLEITDRAVVCLNLVDEAQRHGLKIDERRLARDLGVPVVPTVARFGRGLKELHQAISGVADGTIRCKPFRVGRTASHVKQTIEQLNHLIAGVYPNLPNADWVALRLLDLDERVIDAFREGELGKLGVTAENEPVVSAEAESTADSQTLTSDERSKPNETDTDTQQTRISDVLDQARKLRWRLGPDFYQSIVEGIYSEAGHLADRATIREDKPSSFDLDRTIDHLVTSRFFGIPLMLLMLTVVFWITIAGANVPSHLLSVLLVEKGHLLLKAASAAIALPPFLDGLLIDGIYLATAWVVAVMLPPMAIFFPLFTLLEDFGYLPRVAFNLDGMFKRVGAHGKQGLTMAMGYGCNAAAIVSTRIIESPRERLIAIITNNFSLCNGRWPTQILIATIFVGALAPAALSGITAALTVVAICLLGVLLTFGTSWLLSQTLLRGQASSFSLELPPYRPPRVLKTLYTSIIDRTLFVLWRAIMFAIPAGAVIWLLSNIQWHQISIAEHIITTLKPFGLLIGLNGVILLAYIVAIPANEIVIPTILMLTVMTTGLTDMGAGTGVMFEFDNELATANLLQAGGWTLLTALNLMLFSLVHNPCSTTIYTIYRETKSAKWTTVAALLPLLMGFMLCFFVAQIWRLFTTLPS